MRKLKNKTGHTQQEIADMSGVNASTLGKYFAGINDESANYETVRKLVMCMGGSLDEMAGITPPEVAADEKKLTADGYTETEIKAILRWAGSEISRTYKAVVAGLEARLSEKDERLTHRDTLVAEEHRRAMEEVEHERKRAHTASIISYAALGLFVLLFILDFLLPTMGWIRR